MATTAKLPVKDRLSTEFVQEYGPALDKWFDDRFEKKIEEREANKIPSMAIIATKATMDWAYPPFILASTGATLGWDV